MSEKNNELSYGQAVEELRQIVDSVESGDLEVDQLSAKVARALELVTFCREAIAATELEVEQLFEGAAESSSPESD